MKLDSLTGYFRSVNRAAERFRRMNSTDQMIEVLFHGLLGFSFMNPIFLGVVEPSRKEVSVQILRTSALLASPFLGLFALDRFYRAARFLFAMKGKTFSFAHVTCNAEGTERSQLIRRSCVELGVASCYLLIAPKLFFALPYRKVSSLSEMCLFSSTKITAALGAVFAGFLGKQTVLRLRDQISR